MACSPDGDLDDWFESDEEGVDDQFTQATNRVRQIAGTLDEDTLLFFYARYKQVTEGPCNVGKPYFFNFEAKRKWEAWKSLGDTSRDTAAREYVDKLQAVDRACGNPEAAKTSSAHRAAGPVVSTLRNSTRENENDEKETVFDWVKDGDVDKVASAFKDAQIDVNFKDGEGMTLLHWACDRGHVELVKLLLKQENCDVDAQDSCGQTPLHFASSCGHDAVVEQLLASGASKEIPDDEGDLPRDVATEQIKALLDAT